MATQGDLQQVIQDGTTTAIPDTGPLNTPTDGPVGQDAQIPNGADPAAVQVSNGADPATTGPAPAVNPADAAAVTMLQPPPPIPPPVIIPEELQNALLDGLVGRLTQMGFGVNPQLQPQPIMTPSQSQPGASEPELEWSQWSGDDQNWNQGNWYRGRWGKNQWKDDHDERDRDRPYLSHLDFPTFSGRKEDFPD